MQFPPVQSISPLAPFSTTGLRPLNPALAVPVPNGSVGLPAPMPQNRADFGERVPVNDGGRYARFIEVPNIAVPLASDGGLRVLDAPPGRRNFLLVRNSGAIGNVQLGWGSCGSAQSAIVLAVGDYAFFDSVVPQDDLYLSADVAGALASIAYSNIAP